MKRSRLLRAAAFVAFSSGLAGCALLYPPPRKVTLEERLAAFPTQGLALDREVVIHWNRHQIPFIEAATDHDAAFALGLVHAHLRLAQMELLRRVARGRLAEMVGPLATEIDHSLRILDLARAAPKIERLLPDATRAWLASFLEGINAYQAALDDPPHEHDVLGLKLEPWTFGDLVAIGRLAAVDVNWLVWYRLWKLREREDWPELWARVIQGRAASISLSGAEESSRFADLLGGTGRPGSNAFVVSPSLSESGGALIANDPHLGLTLPNSWLIAGYKSPSYHVVGLMLPGLPFVAVGRNPDIAWGGSNMHAASSTLYEVGGIDEARLTEREEVIRVRWWFDRKIRLRDSGLGPVISDSPFLETKGGEVIALRWLGHEASDEFSAMLKVNRARDWQDFREALAGFAVPGENMLYADAKGNIGQVMAVRVPMRRSELPPDVVLRPGDDGPHWEKRIGAADLPAPYNPPEGFLVSANAGPAESPTPVGYFFSPGDRSRRISDLIARSAPLGLEEVKAMQRDVFAPSSLELKEALIDMIERVAPEAAADTRAARFLEVLRAWDGDYAADSEGAAAFEYFLRGFVVAFYGRRFSREEIESLFSVAHLRSFLADDLAAAAPETLEAAARKALREAAALFGKGTQWGEIHRLKLAHALARLPVLGGRYVFADWPTAGSRETVMKTSHGLVASRHSTGYGSNARYVSDLSDLDANDFLLLGGQDGWLGSTTFLDQARLWRRGSYIRVPLRPETVRATFEHKIVLTPAPAHPPG